jgi:hypothetical protein
MRCWDGEDNPKSKTILTILKISNQSFTEITDIIWQNVSFANNENENSIKIGTNVTNTVESGIG